MTAGRDGLKGAVVPIVLSEEELSALGEGGGPVPLARLAGLDAAGRQLATHTALRSLAARGWVGLGADGQPAALGPLAPVLAARRQPAMVAVAQRIQLPEGPGHLSAGEPGVAQRRWFYGTTGGEAVEERCFPGGYHRFTVATVEGAAAALARFVDPEGWAPRHLAVATVLAPEEGDKAVRGAHLLTHLVSVRPCRAGSPGRMSQCTVLVAASPGGVVVVSAGHSPDGPAVRAGPAPSPAPAPAPAPVVQQVGGPALTSVLRACLEAGPLA